MTQVNDNIIPNKGKHLTYEERIKIEVYKELGYSNRKVARILNRVPQTINNAINQGTVRTIKQRQVHNDKVYEYDQYSYSADADYQIYLRNRQHSGLRPKWLQCDSFTTWADNKMLNDRSSPDMIVVRATKKFFPADLILSTSTFYDWIDWATFTTGPRFIDLSRYFASRFTPYETIKSKYLFNDTLIHQLSIIEQMFFLYSLISFYLVSPKKIPKEKQLNNFMFPALHDLETLVKEFKNEHLEQSIDLLIEKNEAHEKEIENLKVYN